MRVHELHREKRRALSLHRIPLTFLGNVVAYVFQAAVTKRARLPRRGQHGEGRHCVRAHGAPRHSRARRFGVMSSHRIGKASSERRCGPAASLVRPCGALPLDNLDRHCLGRTLVQTGEYFPRKRCAKNNPQFCSLTFAGHTPGRGTSRVAEIAGKEFPVFRRASRAISCRAASGLDRAGSGTGRSLTPRTPIPRLPGLCLSGPFRSELSARSADRGRVVPVLDRSSGRSPIAPFAPSFP